MVDVARWLAEQGLGKHAKAFARSGVAGDVLRDLTDTDLKELGLNLGDRKRLLKAIAALDAGLSQHRGETTPVPREAERRQLTVMFVDMVGSTELAARLDPEDLREVIRDYQAACAGVIIRFEGHVARFLGDGVLAFFGWPKAHEDDAERAVRAGLAIAEEIGLLPVGTEARLAARIGIATGQVVVGDLTSQHAHDRDAVIGETPNLAARLQTLAEPGTVVISEATRRLVGGLFEFDALGPQRLKGFATPLVVWRVARARRREGRFEARQTADLTPLVGRDSEIFSLLRRWQQVADGKGQVVLLLGEPGIGKSRLALAARQAIAASGHFRLVLQCSSLHTDTALHPIIAEIGRVIGLRPHQPDDIPRRRLRRLLSALMPESDHAAHLFARLLGLSEATGRDLDGLSPEVVKERTLAALLDLVERLSSRRLTLIVVEDAQWIDPTSRELLDLLCQRLSRLRVLLLVTARTGFSPAWLAADNCTSLTLRRLPKRYGMTMVRQLCGDRSLPPEDIERITIAAEGVPLFIEELSRAVLEAKARGASGDGPGTAKLDIPATLLGLLTARLDQLGAAKEVAQVGSTIGRSFSVDLARQAAAADEAFVEEALDRLVDLGLATVRGRSRRRVCTFRHVLIQEAAYQSMLRSLRRSVHRRVAELFDEAGRDPHEVTPEIVAYHYAEAGATASAVRKYHEAGQLAATRSANVEAARLLGRALQLLRSLPPGPERDEQELSILVSLGPVITTTSGPGASDVMELYERAIALCAGIRQSPSQFPAYWGWWRASPNFKVMRERAETLAALARNLSDEQLLLQAHHCQWATLFMLGEHEACCAHIAEGLELYERGDYHAHGTLYGGHDPKGCALGEKALSLWLQGFPDASLEAAEQCIEHTAWLGHAGSIAHAKDEEIMLRRYRREAELVVERARSMRAFAAEHRFRDLAAKADIFEGWALAALGQPQAGLGMIEKGLATQREIGTQEDFPVYYDMLAEAYSLAALPERGLALVQEGMEMADETGLQYWTAELLRRKGDLLLQEGETGSALRCFGAAAVMAEAQRARSLQLRAATSKARLLASSGRRQAALACLDPVYASFSGGFETRDLQDAGQLLEGLR